MLDRDEGKRRRPTMKVSARFVFFTSGGKSKRSIVPNFIFSATV